MYQIYADSTLIYDSTLEDYKIGKGEVTLEADKSGSFVFSVYPDHFYYDHFVKLKTVITVYKSGRIVFRGRILNDVTDYWNNKVLTCEGELGFLNDTIVRPFTFQGDHVQLFTDLIAQHNEQVDEFKRFKIGTVTVTDNNEYINRNNTDYSPTLAVLNSALLGSALGGHFYITHGDDGTDPIPTIHYLAEFTKMSSQPIEFGENLKDYTKTAKAEELATAIIPLGASSSSEGHRLTVEQVNNGVDYIYSPEGVALYGWVFKTVVWEDVTLANHLMAKAQAYLDAVVNQNITIELNAIDLHLLDRSIESFEVCSYVPVVSPPHKLNAVMLCHKQTMNLLQPANDTIVLGYQTTSFTGASTQMAASITTLGKSMSGIKQDAESLKLQVRQELDGYSEEFKELSGKYSSLAGTVEVTATSVSNIVEGIGLNGEVTAASIVAAINAAGSSVKINADHVTVDASSIDLSGYVTVNDLAGNGTTMINGSNITTGYISADRIWGGTIQGTAFYTEGNANSGDPLSRSNVLLNSGKILFDGLTGMYQLYNEFVIDCAGNQTFQDAIVFNLKGRVWKLTPQGIMYNGVIVLPV